LAPDVAGIFAALCAADAACFLLIGGEGAIADRDAISKVVPDGRGGTPPAIAE
jgi:hypothetical protein